MSLSQKISAFVCGNSCSDEDEQSIIEFGIGILLSKILNLVTEIIVGCLFSMLAETIIFLIAFSSIRSYAGGFHMSSSGKCYVSSTVTMIIALLIIKYVDSSIVNCIFILFGAILCMAFAPVESQNKPLDITEKIVYRKRVMVILFLILILSAFSLHINMIFRTLSVVLLIEGIMLILGKITLKR
jgi:hypothetical protein ELI_4364